MIIFDGNTFTREMEVKITREVDRLNQQGRGVKIGVLAFAEDETGLTYTRLKREAAGRVGISFHLVTSSFADDMKLIRSNIIALNQDPSITGVMIQKPPRKVWEAFQQDAGREIKHEDGDPFAVWWGTMVSLIDLKKDVDGLHPETLASIKQGSWQKDGRALPATARAVMEILRWYELESVTFSLAMAQIAVIGRSDIVGLPTYYALQSMGLAVDLMGKADLATVLSTATKLKAYSTVISATGRPSLITGDMLQKGVVVIDVGEPKPDIDRKSVATIASFLTPVPGGVGPVTVSCLLLNGVELVKRQWLIDVE